MKPLHDSEQLLWFQPAIAAQQVAGTAFVSVHPWHAAGSLLLVPLRLTYSLSNRPNAAACHLWWAECKHRILSGKEALSALPEGSTLCCRTPAQVCCITLQRRQHQCLQAAACMARQPRGCCSPCCSMSAEEYSAQEQRAYSTPGGRLVSPGLLIEGDHCCRMCVEACYTIPLKTQLQDVSSGIHSV